MQTFGMQMYKMYNNAEFSGYAFLAIFFNIKSKQTVSVRLVRKFTQPISHHDVALRPDCLSIVYILFSIVICVL